MVRRSNWSAASRSLVLVRRKSRRHVPTGRVLGFRRAPRVVEDERAPHRLHLGVVARGDHLLQAPALAPPPRGRRVLLPEEDGEGELVPCQSLRGIVLDADLVLLQAHLHPARALVERVLQRLAHELTERPGAVGAPPAFLRQSNHSARPFRAWLITNSPSRENTSRRASLPARAVLPGRGLARGGVLAAPRDEQQEPSSTTPASVAWTPEEKPGSVNESSTWCEPSGTSMPMSAASATCTGTSLPSTVAVQPG